jgi:hypothetical protein
MTLTKHRITAVALVLIVAAIVAPSAAARPTLPHGVEYSSTQVEPPSTRNQVPVLRVAANPGFDWGDAGIGAGAAFALTMIGLGAVLVLTNRRRREDRTATTA